LKDAVLRIDFAAPVIELSEKLNTKILKAALSRFPISEPKKVQTQEIQILEGGISANTKEVTQWSFYGKEREKALLMSPDALVVQVTNSYKSYEIFTGDFFHVVSALNDSHADIVVTRIGVRYVNVIDLPNGDPLDWDDYINEKMLGIIDIHNKKIYLEHFIYSSTILIQLILSFSLALLIPTILP
jgi:uncharacterized protein (TIGR04255 family)